MDYKGFEFMTVLLTMFAIFLGVLAIDVARTGKTARAVFYQIMTALSVTALAFEITPGLLGYGRVPDAYDALKNRLQHNVLYEVRHAEPIGEPEGVTPGHVILVYEPKARQFHALRVEGEALPKRFMLIDGKAMPIPTREPR